MGNVKSEVTTALRQAFGNKQRSILFALLLSAILWSLDFPNMLGFNGIELTNLGGLFGVIAKSAFTLFSLVIIIFVIVYLTKKGSSTPEELKLYGITAF